MICLPMATPIYAIRFVAYASDFSTMSVFTHSRYLSIIKDVRVIFIYEIVTSHAYFFGAN